MAYMTCGIATTCSGETILVDVGGCCFEFKWPNECCCSRSAVGTMGAVGDTPCSVEPWPCFFPDLAIAASEAEEVALWAMLKPVIAVEPALDTPFATNIPFIVVAVIECPFRPDVVFVAAGSDIKSGLSHKGAGVSMQFAVSSVIKEGMGGQDGNAALGTGGIRLGRTGAGDCCRLGKFGKHLGTVHRA